MRSPQGRPTISHPNCAIALLLPLIVSACAYAGPIDDFGPRDWQTPRYCGINALYFFLRLNDVAVSHSVLIGEVPLSEKGASLEDLHRVATRHGVKSVVVRADRDDLAATVFPCIAHLQYERGNGHFVVVKGIFPGGDVSLIDGTTAKSARMKKGEFLTLWSGYLLVPAPSGRPYLRHLITCVLLGAMFYLAARPKRLLRAPHPTDGLLVRCHRRMSNSLGGCCTAAQHCVNRLLRRRGSCVALCALLIVGVATMVSGTASRDAGRRGTIDLIGGSQPVCVRPATPPLQVLTEDQIGPLLTRAEPFWEYRRIADITHALRIWGANAVFGHPCPYPAPPGVKALSGGEMVGILTDDALFRSAAGEGPPFLLDTDYGVACRMGGDYRSVAHLDDLLAVCAEIGLPLSTPIRTRLRQYHLRDMLKESVMRFTLNQEVDFTAVAFAVYLPPATSWTNRFGETYTFDDLAETILRHPENSGACYGTHRPYALIVLLRINESEAILSSRTAKAIRDYLGAKSTILRDTQAPDGSWTPESPEVPKGRLRSDAEKIRYTGHHLEWLTLAPATLQPPRETLSRAANWLYHAIMRQPEAHLSLGHHYLENSHAIRAICLLQGRFAPRGTPVIAERADAFAVPAAERGPPNLSRREGPRGGPLSIPLKHELF